MPRRAGDNPGVSERIRTRRQLRGWSVRHAADRAGISASTWSRIERGLRTVDNRFMLADIANALGCSVADLTGQPALTSDPLIAAADACVPLIRQALIETAPDEPATRSAPPMAVLEQRVALARDLYRRCDHAGLGRMLPGVLLDLHAAASSGTGARAALGLSVQAHLVTMAALKHFGHPAEAWLAAERGREAAQRLENPVALAVAEFGRTCAATGCDGYRRAHTLAVRGIDALDGHLADPLALEALGLLTLRTAFSSAALKDPDRSREGFAEARRIAVRTGESHSWDMFFGPTNVDVWRIGVETDLGRPGLAVEIARKVNPVTFGAAVRQSAFYLDTARALARARKDREAVRMLLTAERLAPQRVRVMPLARETARGLLERAQQRTDAAELRGFAERAGIAV
ncbi:helix-turn-helix domain-containing protein [Planosporangium sp. 12N6]|uniref:helix-turn-helix domain-containing protein n=1 Tax=Planosporangium spinosum TaxID=3402278 RepID=UPI003CF649C5